MIIESFASHTLVFTTISAVFDLVNQHLLAMDLILQDLRTNNRMTTCSGMESSRLGKSLFSFHKLPIFDRKPKYFSYPYHPIR